MRARGYFYRRLPILAGPGLSPHDLAPKHDGLARAFERVDDEPSHQYPQVRGFW